MIGQVVQSLSNRIDSGDVLAFTETRAAFHIDRLDPSHYAETQVGDFAFAHVHEPHTLAARGDILLFDYYEEPFSWLADWRRLRARLRSSTCASARRHV